MFKRTNVRFIIIALVLVLAAYALYWSLAYNSFSDEKKEELRAQGKLEKFEDNILRLGLDLQGGMHIILELDIPDLIESMAANKTDQFYTILNQTEQATIEEDKDFFDAFEARVEAAGLKLVRHFSNRGYKNAEIIKTLKEEARDARNRAMAIIRNRVDQFGVSEPVIQKAGKYRIICELAGVQDPERARELIQSTALLEFILLKDPQVTQSFITSVDKYLKSGKREEILAEAEETESQDTTVALKESQDEAISVSDLLGTTEADIAMETDTTDTSSLVVDKEMFREKPFSSLLRNVGNMIAVPERNKYAVEKILSDPEVQKLLPYDSQILWSGFPERMTLASGETESYYLLYHLKREADMQGKYVTRAKADLGGAQSTTAGQPIVNMYMNNEGARKFSRLTGANIGRRLAIVLDKKVYMAPNIKSKIPQGSAYIEGFKDMEEAKDIAIVLRAGALPAPVDIIEERTVGPTLGRDSILLGTRLGMIGFAIIVIFMVIYYRASGLLADLALILNLVFVLAVLATLEATLTLPGIAGLILTVGIAVDNNVLIFERIREELDKGKTVRAAIDSGYSRALITILDANLTTIFASLILMQFGTGPVKGFAVTLFWGVVSSFFTAIFVTRTIYNFITERKVLKKLSI